MTNQVKHSMFLYTWNGAPEPLLRWGPYDCDWELAVGHAVAEAASPAYCRFVIRTTVDPVAENIEDVVEPLLLRL
ncbi:hypothetical protein LCGC14_1177190 [marine sediment metagenome]|uniref:Uncharacterized protein n=1 Tax=marine sediment metagenome TaxID=412755 RepID=A0A0F9LT21_9ZZZZ